jgi:hypothetical protein
VGALLALVAAPASVALQGADPSWIAHVGVAQLALLVSGLVRHRPEVARALLPSLVELARSVLLPVVLTPPFLRAQDASEVSRALAELSKEPGALRHLGVHCVLEAVTRVARTREASAVGDSTLFV